MRKFSPRGKNAIAPVTCVTLGVRGHGKKWRGPTCMSSRDWIGIGQKEQSE